MYDNSSTPTANVRTGRTKPRALLATVAVFALALTASCGGASSGGGAQQQPPEGGTQDAPAKEEQALGRETLGDANAPVVLTEYADYQ